MKFGTLFAESSWNDPVLQGALCRGLSRQDAPVASVTAKLP